MKRTTLLTPSRMITAGFLLVSVVGAFFLCLPISQASGEWLNFGDAIFLAVSAISTTGLTPIAFPHSFSVFGQVVMLLLIQFGGLGFMVLATILFLLLGRRITIKDKLAMQEELGMSAYKGGGKLIKQIAIFTLVSEAVGALLIMPVFIKDFGAKGIFYAIFAAVSAFCNAGFDITGGAKFSGASGMTNIYMSSAFVAVPMALLIILGGLGFAVVSNAAKAKKWSRFNMHTKIMLAMTGAVLLVSFALFLFSEYNNPNTLGAMSFFQKLYAAFFQSADTRNAGFAVIDQAAMTHQSRFFTMLLMFIGAGPVSTGGGIRLTTFAVLLLMAVAGMRGRDEVVFNKHSLSRRLCIRAVSVTIFMAMTVLVICGLVFAIETNASFEVVLFECISACTTTGLDMGLTESLSMPSKLLIIPAMFFGRIGPITIGLAILPKKGNGGISYPEGNIII